MVTDKLVTHLLIDLYDCKVDLNDAINLTKTMHKLVKNAGMSCIGQAEVAYPKHGVTIVLFLQESHFLLSTWPEFNTIQLDLAYCGDSSCLKIFKEKVGHSFQAGRQHLKKIERNLQ